ncbi:MAG: response regulator, partial [Comamonadaceae bacterium]
MNEADVITTTIDRSAHTVLVVDDNPTTRYSTARVIRAAGFRTAEAGSGGEALALVAQGVSAVVLDVHLPDIDGFEVCRIIRSQPESALLPVVHLSAEYVRNEDRVAGLNAGADGYMIHPVESAVLVATLQ